MLKGLSPDEFRDWMAYDEIEPIGDIRGDLQVGQVCATIMNSLMIRAGAYEEEKAMRAEHFLIDYDKLISSAAETARTNGGKPVEKWRHWKFLAKMSAAAANADEKKRLAREQRLAESRERIRKREGEKAIERQQAAEKKAKERADRVAIRKVRKK